MVRIKIHGTKQQIKLLTKAAQRTGLATPNKFLAALFDGNHTSQHNEGKLNHSLVSGSIVSRQFRP